MRTQNFIRNVNGVEVPAPGRWRIPNSHVTVTYAARTGFVRRVRARAPEASGAFDIADDLGSASFELSVGASASPHARDVPSLGAMLGDEHLDRLVLRASAIEPTTDGPWRARGEVEFDGVSRQSPVIITYHGVYKAGDGAKAWLTVHAGILQDISGPRRRRPIELVADVLAIGPSRLQSHDPGRFSAVA